MSGLYGEKWSNQYGEWSEKSSTVAIWGAALKGLNEDEIKNGLNAVCEQGSPFVPTAPEFKKLCKGDSEHWEHKAFEIQARETAERLALPKPERNLDVGEKFLSQWKQRAGVV